MVYRKKSKLLTEAYRILHSLTASRFASPFPTNPPLPAHYLPSTCIPPWSHNKLLDWKKPRDLTSMQNAFTAFSHSTCGLWEVARQVVSVPFSGWGMWGPEWNDLLESIHSGHDHSELQARLLDCFFFKSDVVRKNASGVFWPQDRVYGLKSFGKLFT